MKINGPRTGFGFDAHDFSRSGPLVLGGVSFSGVPRLRGHSDGDALLHALIDALLGAACLGDIGDLFPDTDKKFKGIDSRKLLAEALRRVRRAHFKPIHVDVTVVADKPRLSSHKTALRGTLAALLSLPLSSVSVKAKTSEGTRLLRARGGIAVWAVATLVPVASKGN